MRILSLGIVWLSLVVLATDSRADGFSACLDQFPGKAVPKPFSSTVQDLCKFADGQDIFAVRYDTTRKTPNWTVHKLTPAEANGQTKRNRPKFKTDPDIETDKQAIDDSYKGSGYSRGHIVAAADMSWNLKAYKTTFLFSNVVPQKQTFNAGVWLGMEKELRSLVKSKNIDIWGYSGVYGQVHIQPTIGTPPNAPVVPQCFYKIFVTQNKGNKKYKAIAALYHWDDYSQQKTWAKSITTLDQIKKRSGIHFLDGLDLEDSYDASFWGAPMPQTITDCS